MRLPSVATLNGAFPGHGGALRHILEGWTGTDRDAERVLEDCDGALGSLTYGVEVIRGEPAESGYYLGAVLAYINVGDTYDPTLCYDVDRGRFIVCSYGDWVERSERRGVRIY